ncbi:DUF2637 domain-containing protein [Streptomyces sp. NBC_00365]|uniref:DUF2637 domain-containing protein n=1 Tax=Streptomyces sp. NBC_00365 TaxID=2975726 RepID=UPI002252AC74|nr:DUF2637 domain-containing protein [Streptomyces sp. NBC_00365]MCX5092639.1 DUF2637 domain-containing protein [Streptomyces sp. NBC_00365]
MPTPPATGRFARTMITVVMAAIAALAFVFSFGNVWTLARRLGVPHPIAPLIASMVDLSVVGLLIALHNLAAQGASPSQLRPATRLMHLCGLLTLALNTAGPLLARHYGRAALDTVAPALLLGWGTVGPVLLRHLHAPAVKVAENLSPISEVPADTATTTAQATATATATQNRPTGSAPRPSAADPDAHDTQAKPSAPRKRTGRPPVATMEQLIAVALPAVAEYGVSVAVVKQALQEAKTPVGSARFTKLMKHLKDEQAPAPEAAQPESARAHHRDT